MQNCVNFSRRKPKRFFQKNPSKENTSPVNQESIPISSSPKHGLTERNIHQPDPDGKKEIQQVR